MTARDTLGPIQAALFTRLNADTSESSAGSLGDLGVEVFDHVTEGTPKPYVVIGEGYATPRNSHDRFGRRNIETIHIWSDHLGFSEANQIADRVIQLVDNQELTVANHTNVIAQLDFDQTIDDPDPDIRHVILRFVFVTEQTP